MGIKALLESVLKALAMSKYTSMKSGCVSSSADIA